MINESENIKIARSTLTKGEFGLFILVLFLSASYFTLWSLSSPSTENRKITNSITIVNNGEVRKNIVNQFQGLKLEARALYVLDMNNGKSLFAKNENIVLPLASLTKIMTILKAKEILADNTTIKISRDVLSREGDTGLLLDEVWNFQDLVDLTLVSSSNDGAYALASYADNVMNGQSVIDQTDLFSFVKSMNIKAVELGLSSMHFNNETGLDESSYSAGGYGTAGDVASLFSYVIKNYPSLLEATKYNAIEISSLSHDQHFVKNTSTAINAIPAILGSKTGYTDLAQGNLVLAFDAGINYPIIIVVLGSTYDGRFTDAKKLTNATLQFLETKW